MEISIIIVNYRTAQLTSDCIESIRKHSAGDNYEIIVVDNASNDGSAEFLQEKFPEIRVIVAEENLGFGRANNFGVTLAQGKYVFFLNSDTVFLNDVLGEFHKKYEQLEAEGKEPGIIGALMLNDQMQINSSYGYFQSAADEIVWVFRRSLKLVDLQKRFKSQTGDFRVDWVTGADMFMKKKDFDMLTGFDPLFFMYSEEMDLQKRLVKHNKNNYIVSGPLLIHLEGGSSQKKLTHTKRMMVDRSRFIYRRKHSSFVVYLVYRFFYFILRLPSLFNTNYTHRENVKYIRFLANL